MDEPLLDEAYLVWLYSQVGDPRTKNPSRTYWKLFLQLYKKEFVWFVPNDDNRIEDGKALREEFVDDEGLQDVHMDWINLGCSMLELLIGLSRRLAFEAEGEPRDWFWVLLGNIELDNVTDRGYKNHDRVDDILDRVIWRTYDTNGRGGLFPLNKSKNDQREVELWYQLGEYVMERAW